MDRSVVQVIFIQQVQVLLGFRQNTEALDQLWGFPAGRVEANESPLAAATRESLEEVSAQAKQLEFLIELTDPTTKMSHHFYLCTSWKGDIKNAEPHLCRDVKWFDMTDLPPNCTPMTYTALTYLLKAKPNDGNSDTLRANT